MHIEGYDVPNTIEELTIEQFDHLNSLEFEDLTSLDRWLKKFTYLGVPEEVFDDFSFEDMTAVIQEFNEGFDMTPDKILEVEIEGFNYIARESISAKDMSLIEKTWKGDKKDFSAESMAILFKREDLSRTEHYTPAHIKLKTDLFKGQPCKIAIPFLNEILTVVTKTTESIVSE